MGEVGWSLLAIVLLGGVSLFFSLNTLALRLFSRVRLQEIFRAVGRERLVDGLIENVDRFILTCAFLTVAAEAGWLVVLVRLLLGRGVGYLPVFAIVLAIFLVLRFALPYAWSRHTAEAMLLQTSRVLSLCAVVVAPVLCLYRWHDEIVKRLAGVKQASADEMQEEKQEEILSFVEQGRMEGVVDKEEVEMIENVLELSDTTAEEIMTPRTDVIAIEADSDLDGLLATISRAGHSRIPVYENNIDNIIGLVYAKDLLAEVGRRAEEFNLRDKIRKAYFVPESKPLRSLLHEFQNQKLHIAIVLDEYGGTAGIVTIEDILEELVGEIVDEYEDAPPETVKKLDEDTIEIDARMYIDDLNDRFDFNLPEDEDYDTVGGFVFSHLGYIPPTGQTFEYHDISFTIADAEARKINRIRIRRKKQGRI